jgi:hypothetical protein
MTRDLTKIDENQISVRKLNQYIKKVRLNDGDIILLMRDCGVQPDILMDAIGRAGYKDVTLVLVEDMEDLSAINEASMTQHGWYHITALKKIVNREQLKQASETDDEEH